MLSDCFEISLDYLVMEKLEWREAFNRQPIYYLFFDLSVPMSFANLNVICQVLQNIAALSNSLKGCSRFSMLGIYTLSARSKCIFTLQSIKHNFSKLQFSLESMQASQAIHAEEGFEINDLKEILQDVVKQFENYFQGAMQNREDWPQLQIIFFSAQTAQNFVKIIQKALPSIHLAYINKVEIIILRGRGAVYSLNSSESKPDAQVESSPTLFGNDDTDDIISSLLHITEIDANAYQIESVMKQWLHDYSSDSDHLRLTLGHITLRCDIKECLLNADALPVTGQFYLFPDAGTSQNAVRTTSANRQKTSKVPVYMMDAVAVVQKDGVCESLLFGHSYITTATRCWKIDWDELDRNQQLFLGVVRHLYENNLVLLAKKQNTQIMSSEKILPTGYFIFFPSKNALLVKSAAASELMLPTEEMNDKDISEELAMEVKECLEGLEHKQIYNPLTMTSGLYSYLNSSLSKKTRPSTSFVTPIVAYDGGLVEGKKKKKPSISTADASAPKNPDGSFRSDFITASALLKLKFSSGFE